MSEEKKEKKERDKKTREIRLKVSSSTILLAVVIAAVVIVGGAFLGKQMSWFKSEEGKVTTISKSSLEEVLEINQLSTLEYIYNAVAPVQKKNFNSIKYYVAYQGVVTAGIDFTKIDIQVDDENKIITITVPEVEIQNVRVDAGTMRYIFNEEEYETENVSAEAYSAAVEHLTQQAGTESRLFDMAQDNAIDAISALITPWVNQVDSDYTVQIEGGTL